VPLSINARSRAHYEHVVAIGGIIRDDDCAARARRLNRELARLIKLGAKISRLSRQFIGRARPWQYLLRGVFKRQQRMQKGPSVSPNGNPGTANLRFYSPLPPPPSPSLSLSLSQPCFRLFLLHVRRDERDGDSLTLIYRDAFIAP